MADSDDNAPTPPAATAGSPHGAAMRRRLLAKVPKLEYHGKSVLAELGLNQDNDLRGAVELEADAFLTPLAATTPGQGDRAGGRK